MISLLLRCASTAELFFFRGSLKSCVQINEITKRHKGGVNDYVLKNALTPEERKELALKKVSAAAAPSASQTAWRPHADEQRKAAARVRLQQKNPAILKSTGPPSLPRLNLSTFLAIPRLISRPSARSRTIAFNFRHPFPHRRTPSAPPPPPAMFCAR